MNDKIDVGRPKVLSTAILLSIASFNINAAVLEEIVVTAQKREQSLQDVGVSVSAFSGDQMKALGVTNSTEIVQQVPGLQLNQFSPNITIFNLRGISQSNFMDNLEAPVAVFVDDAYIGSMNAISGQLFDVKRVEVLRGPQGTLFGRNATGGLIHYVSRGATDDELNGYVEATVADYDKRAVEAAAGGSVSDKVRYRVSGRWEESDGYIEATQPGVRDLNGADGIALRANIQVDFTDDLTGDFWVKYADDDDVPTGGYTIFPCVFDALGNCTEIESNGISNGTTEPADPFSHDGGTDGHLNRETRSYIAKFNWDFEAFDFVSITNYMDMDKEYLEDGDGAPPPIVEFETTADYTQFTQELRLSGETDSLRWQAGLYYMDIEIDGQARTFGAPIAAIAAGFITSDPLGMGPDPYGLGIAFPDASVNLNHFEDYQLDSKNWSVFGQVEYDLSQAFTLILGYRWSEDDKDLEYGSRLIDLGGNGPLAGVFGPSESVTEFFGGAATGDPLPGFDVQGLQLNDSIDYSDYAARVQLDWRVGDNSLLFASWSRGIKGGNWSILTAPYVDPGVFQHKEEVLNSYELGIKTTLMEGVARLNATLFYYDYDDYQAFAVFNLFPQVQNSDATSQGGEIELFLTPDEHWDIVLGLSAVDSEVEEVVAPFGDIITDTEFPNAPGYSFNYLARYNWDTLGGNMAVQLDGTYDDDQYLEVSNNSQSLQEAGGIVNARIRYTSEDEHWSVTGWVQNLTDEERKSYTLDLGILGVTGVYAPPRWYGVTLNYKF